MGRKLLRENQEPSSLSSFCTPGRGRLFFSGIPTAEDPLRILTSACLMGTHCVIDGTHFAHYPDVLRLKDLENVRITRFCPEHFSYGTPRQMSDIHGGDGFDVLDGKARVLTPTGEDWTDGMIRASEKMLEVAREADIEVAILMDMSAACGSQVIYDGDRYAEDKKYQVGMGVCAAQLQRGGIKIVAQRDFATLEILFSRIDPAHEIDPEAKDHDQHPWTLEYFAS